LRRETAETSAGRSSRQTACAASRFEDWTRHYEVDVVWEAFTHFGWRPVQAEDGTRALTLSGFVRLELDVELVAGSIAATAGSVCAASPRKSRSL